jgi:protein-tyrosine phosphatase
MSNRNGAPASFDTPIANEHPPASSVAGAVDLVYAWRPMETKVVKINSVQADIEAIKHAAQVIDSGGLVAFPTETVYGIACKVGRHSLSRLDEVKGRGEGKCYSLHIAEKCDVDKYVPRIGLRAKKLVDKAWPGPLTIVFELDQEDLAKQRARLGEEIFEGLYRNGSIGVRCPASAIATALLRHTKSAVVAPSANVSGAAPAIDADGMLQELGGKIDMVLDGGPCTYRKSSTVVKVGMAGVELLREGVYSRSEIEEMGQVQFLFVCTGNSCRSPMAQGIFKKYLAEKLRCSVDRLQAMGYKVASAGTLGAAGFAASQEAIAACAAKGVDIDSHTSRALSRESIEGSDFVFVMEQMHRQRVVAICPEAEGRCVLLAEGGIGDPIGQPQEVYDRCADLIERSVKKRISELVL